MITRIEIDGFKSFRNFVVDLKPFQVLIGPNGAGKSNLFDAIILLSHLAGDNTLHDAFRKSRGDIKELFTILPDGGRTPAVRFAVEMLIARHITDDTGVDAEASSTRVRYEIMIERREEAGFDRLYLADERLTAITEDSDRWFREHIPARMRRQWIVRGRRAPYISSEGGKFNKHQDGRAGRYETPKGRVERTILSTINTVEYPTAYAVRQEMLNWQFLQLNPSQLREPSRVQDRPVLQPDGSRLAAMLWRLKSEDQALLADISRDLANLVPGMIEIEVRLLAEREEFLIEARTRDGATFSSRLLSDGTLRLLALIALRADPSHHGVICLEEPENGVHPLRLEQIADLLTTFATDFDDQDDEAPRQVIVNTHSPKFLSHVNTKNVLYLYISGSLPRYTRVGSVTPDMFSDETNSQFAVHQIRQLLEFGSQEDALRTLEQQS